MNEHVETPKTVIDPTAAPFEIPSPPPTRPSLPLTSRRAKFAALADRVRCAFSLLSDRPSDGRDE